MINFNQDMFYMQLQKQIIGLSDVLSIIYFIHGCSACWLAKLLRLAIDLHFDNIHICIYNFIFVIKCEILENEVFANHAEDTIQTS